MKKIFLFILCLSALSTFSLAKEPVDDRRVSLSHNIFNFHMVAPNVMRGSQPSKKSLKILRKHYNVKTILNLRKDEKSIVKERKITEKLGMNFINIPMNGGIKQDIGKIETCLSIINDESYHPIFVHCRRGKHRAGLIFAAYRIKYDNWSLEDALTEMFAYGCNRMYSFNLEESLIKWHNWRQSQ